MRDAWCSSGSGSSELGVLEADGRSEREFRVAKQNALGKKDKSSAGGIDPRAVSICAAINKNRDWFTTSSCSGRCYVWRGVGIKATDQFSRGRVSHELIDAAYFLEEKEGLDFAAAPLSPRDCSSGGALWLRFEPFILHVRCRTMAAAHVLCRCARSAFKNVGVAPSERGGVATVAIVGDECLETALRGPRGTRLIEEEDVGWLVDVVNEKHARNWEKTEKFREAVELALRERPTRRSLRFDVVGDVAIVRSSEEIDFESLLDKKVRVVCAASSSLSGSERAGGLVVKAGGPRSPLVTTHIESGVAFVVDLDNVFFCPRMAPERTRACEAVKPGERVLALFAGCGPEALSIAARTHCAKVVAVENNPVAVRCCERGIQALRRRNPTRAAVVDLVEADAKDYRSYYDEGDEAFDRILAPRPKTDDGLDFLEAVLDLVVNSATKNTVLHWTDFASDAELPECSRTKQFVADQCARRGLDCRTLYAGKAGPSVAARQYRVTVDFLIAPSATAA